MDITEQHSFYRNWNGHYFLHQDNIVYISPDLKMKIYNIKTKKFTSESLTQVNYQDLKVDYLYHDHDHAVVIDVINKQWARTTNFPYFISEIDGNYITTCKKDHYYIFHSHTEQYETGVFIFDIQNNSYEHVELKQLTDIISCAVYNHKIFLNVDGDISEYNPITHECHLILKTPFHNSDIKTNAYLLIEDKNNIHIYDFKTLVKSIKIDRDFIRFWDIYDDQILVLCENHRDALNSSYEEYFKSRQSKICMF